jgi:hypothetical protein
MFSSRSDEWTIARWRQPNVAGLPLEFADDDRDMADDGGSTPLWKDLTVASGLALALWALAALLFLG